uniref:Transcription factor IIIA n=1 Tax=Mola mola TaxID=94237 RepID=A0A3Q3W5D0_MOLML
MGERFHGQKSFVCSFFDCKAKFSKSWKLEAHLCKHTGLKPFSCESCDKSFCTRYQLTRHELNHSGEKTHKCLVDGCTEAFVTNASLKNHMARAHHKQEKQYQVQEIFNEACPFQGKTWTDYLKHTKEHKIKVPCGECKKLFNNAWFLHQHELRVHGGERRKLLCPREGCNKEFTRRFNLESHVLGDHEGKRPFSCAYAGCGKSFAMRVNQTKSTDISTLIQLKVKHFVETNPT